MATEIYDLRDSLLMGLDVVGTALELGSDQPVTVGGRAHWRYRRYLLSFLPEGFRPELPPDLRVKRYFRAQGLRLAPANVYIALVATFLSWPLVPILQPLNLCRFLRHRLARPSEGKGARGRGGR